MFPGNFSKRQITLTLVLVASFALTSAYTVQNLSKPDVRLRELADHAALAGVNSLAATVNMPEALRVEASVAAARSVMAARPGVISRISPSVDQLTMSVVLDDSAKGSRASSTAHYIPPSDGFSSERAADVSDKVPLTIAKRARS